MKQLLASQLEMAKRELEQLKLEQAAWTLLPKRDAEENPPTKIPPPGKQPRRSHLSQQELAAYRRAEQAERNAMVRARKLREQLSLLCEQSKDRYTDAGERNFLRSPPTCPPAFPVCRRRLPTFRPSSTTWKARSTSSSPGR